MCMYYRADRGQEAKTWSGQEFYIEVFNDCDLQQRNMIQGHCIHSLPRANLMVKSEQLRVKGMEIMIQNWISKINL